MSSIKLVTHCYAAELSQYAVYLRAQLSSLLLHETRHDVNIAVCCGYVKDDPLTRGVIDEFYGLLGERLVVLPFENQYLFRRAIGRNVAALAATEDLVWFTDVDYIFGEGCFDSLIDNWNQLEEPKPAMVWPRKIFKQSNQNDGDLWWNKHLNDKDLLDIGDAKFCSSLVKKPIGGMQIVNGEIARTFGYLNSDEKWHRPEEQPFRCFRDDSKFRRFCGKNGGLIKIPIQNIYRLRHTATTYKWWENRVSK